MNPWAVREPCDEAVIQSRIAGAGCSKTRGRWILAATILASSMAFIDGTVVNVALPALQASLNATAIDVQWVIESYALLLSALVLIGGSLGDHFGRRRVFLIGLVLFTIASATCGFSGNVHQLIIARAFQGLGAALLVPGSLAIISTSFSDEERGRAIGTWSGLSAITTAVGPVLGGWLIQHVSWRAAFFINPPIALVVLVISLRHVTESAEKEKTRVDWIGALLASLGLGALVYGLIESSRLGFADRSIVFILVVALLLLAAFAVVEARVAQPMLPLSLFRSRNFTVANLLTFFLYAALGGNLFLVPLNLIQIQGYTPTEAGAAFLPFIIIMSSLSRWSGGLVTNYGPRPPLVVGSLIAAAGFALFLRPTVGGPYWTTFFPAVAVLGLGMAISVAPLTTTVMNSVGPNWAGAGSGVNNAVARTAGLLAIAVLGIVMLHVFQANLSRRMTAANVPDAVAQSVWTQRTRLAAITLPETQDPALRQMMKATVNESFISAFRTVMGIGAALALASALTASTLTGTRHGSATAA